MPPKKSTTTVSQKQSAVVASTNANKNTINIQIDLAEAKKKKRTRKPRKKAAAAGGAAPQPPALRPEDVRVMLFHDNINRNRMAIKMQGAFAAHDRSFATVPTMPTITNVFNPSVPIPAYFEAAQTNAQLQMMQMQSAFQSEIANARAMLSELHRDNPAAQAEVIRVTQGAQTEFNEGMEELQSRIFTDADSRSPARDFVNPLYDISMQTTADGETQTPRRRMADAGTQPATFPSVMGDVSTQTATRMFAETGTQADFLPPPQSDITDDWYSVQGGEDDDDEDDEFLSVEDDEEEEPEEEGMKTPLQPRGGNDNLLQPLHDYLLGMEASMTGSPSRNIQNYDPISLSQSELAMHGNTAMLRHEYAAIASAREQARSISGYTPVIQTRAQREQIEHLYQRAMGRPPPTVLKQYPDAMLANIRDRLGLGQAGYED